MNIDFLNQTLENDLNCVGNVLMNLLTDLDYHTFWGISAFASSAGVNGIASILNKEKEHIKEITIIVGVDQKGTSKEALESLLNSGVESYIFYQKENPIFHPKVYLLEGNNKTDILIGSSNLTTQGLFINSEASVHLKLNNDNQSDKEVIENFKLKFRSLLEKNDPNMQPLTKELIKLLVDEGIVPDENERRRIFQKNVYTLAGKTNDKFNSIFPKRDIKKAPNVFKSHKHNSEKTTFIPSTEEDPSEVTTSMEQVLWSKVLSERDLNIPQGKNTHLTGSMFFSKGLMKDINPRHYFRNVVFANLNWQVDTKPSKRHYERTFANFTIVINGVDKGTYNLEIKHNTRTSSRSYEQKNSVTSLVWGDAKSIIKDRDLLDKRAYLYRKGSGFLLKIE